MSIIRVPIKDFRAKDKHKLIPKGEKEDYMRFTPETLFIYTKPIVEPEPVEEEEAEEEETPDDTWTKTALIEYAKEHDVYEPEMEKRSYTKADILNLL